MNRLFLFIKKIYLFIIFIILEVLAFNIYQDSSVYTRGELHNISNHVMIEVHKTINNVKEYFQLKGENSQLARQNAELEFRLAAMEAVNMRLVRGEVMDTLTDTVKIDATLTDTLRFFSDTTITLIDVSIKKDRYISARVVNNSVDRRRNFITLDRGEADSIKVNYPVVTNNMVVGYIVAVSRNYSIAVSVLNTEFKSSGTLSSDSSLCSVYWSGDSPDEIDFTGISRYSKIKTGDTILTTGFSSYFTPGKLFGTVTKFEVKDQMYYGGKIKLLTSFNKLRFVEIIYPDKIDERFELEDSVQNIYEQ